MFQNQIEHLNKRQLNQYIAFEFNSSNVVVAAAAVAEEGWWNPTWNENSKSLHENNRSNNKLFEIISFSRYSYN